MPGHDCIQSDRLKEIEKRIFPSAMIPFNFLLEDAVFKRESAKAIEKQVAEHESLVVEVRELKERSDNRDREIEERVGKRLDQCRAEDKFSGFYKDEFIPLKEGIIEKKWIHDIIKPLVISILTFVLMAFLKEVFGL